LCEKLGVSVTSIYWHVGNKEALLDALVERMEASIVDRKPRGKTPQQRVRSVARSLLDVIEAHGELIAIAHQRGAITKVFAPARQVVAVEFFAAGLRGERLAEATRSYSSSGATRSCNRSLHERQGSKKERPSRGKKTLCRSIALRPPGWHYSRTSIGRSRPDSTPSSADSFPRNPTLSTHAPVGTLADASRHTPVESNPKVLRSVTEFRGAPDAVPTHCWD
jgi:AcrR family transcriptional regulator